MARIGWVCGGLALAVAITMAGCSKQPQDANAYPASPTSSTAVAGTTAESREGGAAQPDAGDRMAPAGGSVEPAPMGEDAAVVAQAGAETPPAPEQAPPSQAPVDAAKTAPEPKAQPEAGRPQAGERQRFDAEAFFRRRDLNGDGKLSDAEIPEQMAPYAKQIDTNGDGAISLEEMKSARPPEGIPRPEPAELMRRLDKNNDGKITTDELPERGASFITRADANGDGAITEEELRTFRRGSGQAGEAKGAGPRRQGAG